VGVANLTAWCSRPRGHARTRDVLILDAVRLCAGVPARSTVRSYDILMNGFSLQSTTTPRKVCKGIEISSYDRDLLGTNIAPTSLDSSVAAWAEAKWISWDGLFAFPLK
ncbi:unnamed protein product, partial [Prunus brigantina]